ncbi:MAG: DM13 domain-containing protein [Sphingobacteriales bacterium]|nr:DM13 domain-containing protein [Sphingobacteriales bacterium]MBI3720793.1 DM13 domain-containing protein [Sphingobacteriales bacterium]
MKKLVALCFIVMAVACKKDLSPTIPVNDNPGGGMDSMGMMMNSDTPVVLLSGTFINGPYGTTTGTAKIIKDSTGAHRLYLENFTVSNGPDLKVYLSSDLNAGKYLRLGSLKSTNGNQLYDIPGKPDYNEYKYALIWCESFAHLFGSAALK